MRQPPREPGGAILTVNEYLQMVGVGAIMAGTALFAFWHFLPDARHAPSPHALAHARAIVFAILAVGPLAYSFSCRSERKTLLSLGVFSNRALWGAALIGLLLAAITIYVPPLRPLFKTAPLSATDVAWVLALSLVPFVLVETIKLILPRR
jgi:Ca2+-transporting ATPase